MGVDNGNEHTSVYMTRVTTAIAATSLLFIAQFLQVPVLTWQLEVALVCFVAVLPVKATLILHGKYVPTTRRQGNLVFFAYVMTFFLFPAGVGFTVFHLSNVAGCVFVIAVIYAISISPVDDRRADHAEAGSDPVDQSAAGVEGEDGNDRGQIE